MHSKYPGLVLMLITAFAGCGTPGDELIEAHGALNSAGSCPGFTDDQACICAGADFQGTCGLLDSARHFFANAATDLAPVGNDQIESIAAGGNVKVKYCSNSEFQGSCITLSARGIENILRADLANQVSSMRVDSLADNCQSPGVGKVALFADANYKGDCVVIAAGNYPSPAYTSNAMGTNGSFGLKNDELSSLIVGPQANITLYWDINYGRGTLTFGQNTAVPNLGAYNWNDGASSCKVY